MRPRLLALDIDGTLLDPYGDLSEGVREAVGAAARRGLHVVLCTGRRFRTAQPIARTLGLTGPIVVHNGVVVKSIETGSTEFASYLPAAVFGEILSLVREVGPPLVYVDAFHERTDIYTERPERAHAFQAEYLDDNIEFVRVVADLGVRAENDVIMLSSMADETTLAALQGQAQQRFGSRVLTHLLMNKVYRGHILEFLAPDSGKWPTLRRLAASLGIGPEAIAAVGDDHNDAEMIREAGLGIAMGNAAATAQAGANLVVRSNAEGGAIEAIERVLLDT